MKTDLLLVPYDSGRRSTRMGRGPEHLVASGLVESLRAGGHDPRVATIESAAGFRTENAVAFELARRLSDQVRTSRREGRLPLVLAGNCSTSLGTVAGLGRDPVGVVWFDGHGDLNTPETSRSAFLDGMALSVLTGRCWRAAAGGVSGFRPVEDPHVLLVGARDFDPEEADLLEESGIGLVRPGPIRERGVRQTLGPCLEELRQRVERVYLHLDLDVLDPGEGAANQFAAPGGLTVAEVLQAVDMIGARFETAAAALTAYDPAFDAEGGVCRAAMKIVESVVEPS